MGKTACIFGSTGLVGSCLVSQLIDDSQYEKIIVFNRKKQGNNNPKIVEIVDDYSNLAQNAALLKADEYYCCLGTTIGKAKSKPAFEYVDYNLPIEIGNLAQTNDIKYYLVVSSIGASPKSGNFYLRTKGGMEEALTKLNINNLFIFRPSLILGKRNETRVLESISKVMMIALGFLFVGPIKKYRAIHAKTIAKAMINTIEKLSGKHILESDQIQEMSKF